MVHATFRGGLLYGACPSKLVLIRSRSRVTTVRAFSPLRWVESGLMFLRTGTPSTSLGLKALILGRSRSEHLSVAREASPDASLGFSFWCMSRPDPPLEELRATAVTGPFGLPRGGFLLHPRGEPLGRQPPSPMVSIDSDPVLPPREAG